MKWIKIEEEKPQEFSPLLLTDQSVIWVGFYQICRTFKNQEVMVWWASNANEVILGLVPYLAHEPKFWMPLPELPKDD